MLKSIYIENFTIIDHLQIDFQAGMNVLSGETGAGKSIIIDAIGQLAGNRTQLSLIKEGCQKCLIEGVFDINQDIKDVLQDYDLVVDDDLIISKSISIDGRTTIKLNYRPITQSLLKNLAPHLVDIHNQFDNQLLLNESYHLDIFDQYIGEAIVDIKNDYNQIYQEYISLKKEYDHLINEEFNDEQIEFYQTQLKEIENFDFSNFDEDQYIEERDLLKNGKKIMDNVQSFHNVMNSRVLNDYQEALSYMRTINDISGFDALEEKLEDNYYNLKDIVDDIQNEAYQLNFSPQREEEIFDILTTFNSLKRKYGNSVEAILDYQKQLHKKIDTYFSREETLLDYQNKISNLQDKINDSCKKIHEIRKNGIQQFSNDIEKQLKSLYLPNVSFQIVLKNVEPNKNGSDQVQFLISTNVGETPKPLNNVASGGEMSRIMLALKIIFNTSKHKLIVFDEADTGVSGRVAEAIGKKMANLAKKNQIICITHLAQVAAFANTHYLISKSEEHHQVHVTVNELTYDKSIEELAKMISGASLTKESIEHAKKLKQNHV